MCLKSTYVFEEYIYARRVLICLKSTYVFEEYIYAVEVDSVNGLIYWTEYGTFKKARLDGSNQEVVGKAGKRNVE